MGLNLLVPVLGIGLLLHGIQANPTAPRTMANADHPSTRCGSRDEAALEPVDAEAVADEIALLATEAALLAADCALEATALAVAKALETRALPAMP